MLKKVTYLVWKYLIEIKVFLISYSFRQSTLEPILKNKRIAIVGPADSALNTGRGDYIDNFDLVVRINQGYKLLKDDALIEDIGSRTDILFHNLAEREREGKDEVFYYDDLKKQSLKYIIGNLRAVKWSADNIIISDFLEKYKDEIDDHLIILDKSNYERVYNYLNKRKPTRGFVALYNIINSGASEIFITGFTFFQTQYISGYRDYTSKSKQIERFDNSNDSHDPDTEFQAFKELYQANKDKIELDEYLKNAVE